MQAVATLSVEQFSPSVLAAVGGFAPDEQITAAALARAIAGLHPEYAGGAIASVEWRDGGMQRTASTWATLARDTLIDHGLLEGRLLIVALGMLDPGLSARFPADALTALRDEIHARNRAAFTPWGAFASTATNVFSRPAIDAIGMALGIGRQGIAADSTCLLRVLLQASEQRGRDAATSIVQLVPLSVRDWLSATPSDPQFAPEIPLTREMRLVLDAASRIAHGQARSRHLMVAILANDSATSRSYAQYALTQWGVDLSLARKAVLDFLLAQNDPHLADAEALLSEGTAGDAGPRREPAIHLAGYMSDTVKDVVDKLGVERDVAALSALVAAEKTDPPLSIGLFGDWGSGKSFFMERMRGRVKRLQGEPEFCHQIVQIEFNAWHYLDANLWASLVTHIFDQLAGHMNAKAVGEKLKAAQGLFSAAQADVDRARKDVVAAESALTTAQIQRERQERSFASLADDVGRILMGRPDIAAVVEQAATRVGVAPAMSSYREFTRSLGELHTVTGRATALVHSVLADPARMTNLPLLGLVLLLPIGLAALTELSEQGFGADMSWVAKGIGSVTTTMLGLVAWMGTQVKTGGKWIDTLHSAHAEVTRVREQKIAESEQHERAELELARERESVAKKRLEEATLQLKRLEQEGADSDPGPRLRRFIEERTASADYTKHLSVVTLIRKDFEKLSELIEKRDPALPIDRIVLYVDDLDRCRPERVIEVLEAVHLLLAFRLFVVVVAVDPRWLARCLELHYPQLLGGRLGDTVDAASPQDYLEKIFQIPFMVRSIDIDGYRALVRSLIPAAQQQPAKAVRQPDANVPQPVATETPSNAIPPTPLNVNVPQGTAIQMPANVGSAVQQVMSDVELAIDPRRLELSEWERNGLEALAPLFTTPRSVKRFVNIYRLLRVSLWQAEVAAFDGTAGKPGDHATVLLLLALVTNYPRLTGHLLQQATSADLTTWADLVGRVTMATAAAPEGLAPDDVHDWKVLCRRLSQLDAKKLPGPLATSRTWKPRVVRYSFCVDQRH